MDHPKDYKFQIINPIHYEGWDEQIVTLPGFSFFHSAAWAKVLSASYGYEPQYLVWFSGDLIKALVPMMDVKSRLTGHRGVSLPFTDFCEPIIDDKLSFKDIFQHIVELGRKNGWKYIELRGGQQFLADAIPSRTYLRHALSLSKDEKQVMSSFRDSTKRNIKKAQRAGVEVRILAPLEAIKDFYRLNCITRRRHGLPPQPYRFFREVYEHVLEKDLGFVALAYHKNKAIAANVYLHLGDKAVYKYGASDYAYNDLRANNIVMWDAIKWYCQNGFSQLDLGRTEPEHEGLRQFKNGWGGRERIFHYYRYDLRRSCLVTEKQNKIKIVERVLPKFPAPLLRCIGSVLYKHMG